MRTFDLRLPGADAEESDGGRPVASLHFETDAHLYVPKVLQRAGLAGYEPETMACFLALIERFGGPVFDVGANIGVFSLVAAAATDADIVAFEPTPELAAIARALAEANALRFRVDELALGATTGTATFHLSNVTDSSNSLRAGFRPSDTSIEVPTETLDDHVARTGVVPSVLKIDTEATEPDVLRGGLQVLAEHRPWMICEVLAGRTEAELEEVLGPLDYHWYQITSEERPPARRELFGDRTYQFNNWLLAPEPVADDLWERARWWRDRLERCPPPAAAPPRPTSKRGVYGRKKMLAGFLTGAACGAAAATAARRWASWSPYR